MALQKILVISREHELQKLARPFTKQLFAADDTDDLRDILRSVNPDLILLDAGIPQQKTCDFLSDLQDRYEDIPVIVASKNEELANEDQLKALGARHCLKGSEERKRLGEIIDQLQQADDELSAMSCYFHEECPSSVSIVGRSQATQKTLKMIRTVAKSSCNPVLIVGETGTGKELAARAVHILRHGSESRFVAVNCAALTANLLESELFGHVKGSFTSAEREKTGLLELASGGSIFLDEISEMPRDLQAKLLRVIQERTFRKVGGTKDLKCEATIIASSNRKLLKAVEEGKFRRDLYYRLAICPIALAPLRTSGRREDIPLLAEYFLETSEICPDKKGKIKGLTKMAMQALQEHSWPGNVRELRNVIERAIMLEGTDKIGLSSLLIHPDHGEEDAAESCVTSNIKDFSLERAEKELIARALNEAGWQKTRAASMLGITRATLYAKVKQYEIKEPSKQAVPA